MQALEYMALGLAITAGGSMLLLFLARRCQTAVVGTFWASEAAATAAALILVAVICTAATWIVHGTLILIPEPLSAIAAAFVLTGVVLFAFPALMGKLRK
ncbi:MAG: hypothetical protein SFW09_23705 [Hyphomicrobiaceae bacterium]|nr:hypothetical protein [Hyphomicrobiaceae bacterium]